MSTNGKGDAPRPVDGNNYRDNHDMIFGRHCRKCVSFSMQGDHPDPHYHSAICALHGELCGNEAEDCLNYKER